MAEVNQAAPTEQNQGQMRVQKIYVKDISLETPNSPRIFMTQAQAAPEVSMNMNTKSDKLADDLFEVVLQATITVKMSELTAFLVEVQQGGVFTLSGFSQQQLNYMLGAYCPNIIFPYLRETVSDLVTRGGFPTLLLDPVNFDALFSQHMQQRQAETASGGTATVSEAP